MPTYKFCATPFVGAKMDGRDIICGDDEEALNLASKMAPGYAKIDVWLGAILVGTARFDLVLT